MCYTCFVNSAPCFCALPIMTARRAVLLTSPKSVLPNSRPYLYIVTSPRLISFICHSYENTEGVPHFFPFRNSISPASIFRQSIFLASPSTHLPVFSASGDAACGDSFFSLLPLTLDIRLRTSVRHHVSSSFKIRDFEKCPRNPLRMRSSTAPSKRSSLTYLESTPRSRNLGAKSFRMLRCRKKWEEGDIIVNQISDEDICSEPPEGAEGSLRAPGEGARPEEHRDDRRITLSRKALFFPQNLQLRTQNFPVNPAPEPNSVLRAADADSASQCSGRCRRKTSLRRSPALLCPRCPLAPYCSYESPAETL
jgi:hypothetical protein